MERTVDFVTRGLAVPGGGSPVRRYLGTPELDQIDPVVLLDWFETDHADTAPSFAPHPHRGIETLTLMIAGGMEHFDNLGHRAQVGAGGAQLMRAGRGLLHAERPVAAQGPVFGLQFWFNLARADKTLDPDYQPIPPEAVPREDRGSASVRVVIGRTAGGTQSPARPRATDPVVLDVTIAPGGACGTQSPARPRATDPVVLDVTIAPGGAFGEPMGAGRTGFLIVVAGEVNCAGQTLVRGDLGRLGPGDALSFSSASGGRAVVVSGRPIGENVVRSGPFVMNTRAEILAAYEDVRSGGFGPRIAVPPAIS